MQVSAAVNCFEVLEFIFSQVHANNHSVADLFNTPDMENLSRAVFVMADVGTFSWQKYLHGRKYKGCFRGWQEFFTPVKNPMSTQRILPPFNLTVICLLHTVYSVHWAI